MSEQDKNSAQWVGELLDLVDGFLEHMAALEEENQALRAQLGRPVAEPLAADSRSAADAPTLVLDADPARAQNLSAQLAQCGCTPTTTSSAAEALALLEHGEFAVAFVQGDLDGNGEPSGLEFIQRARESNPELECIVLVGFSSADRAVQALRLGAADFMIHPVEQEDLESRVASILGRRQITLRSRRYLSDFRQRYQTIRQQLHE